MKQYEITYFSDPQLTEEGRQELDGSIESKITDASGAIEKSTPSARRRIMYPIKKKVNGFLRAINIQLEPDKIAEVRQMLKKETGVLRFTIIQTAPRPEVAPDIVERHAPQRKGAKKAPAKTVAPKATKPAKEVTMEDVEKGIEDALTEEVK